ncbi:hypothetical protein PV350_28495 [Streptomyces sp. PA03-6a]|nr:hypothetical protein [Streptomyces sp. PA03-6a]
MSVLPSDALRAAVDAAPAIQSYVARSTAARRAERPGDSVAKEVTQCHEVRNVSPR